MHQSHTHPCQFKPVHPLFLSKETPIPVAARHFHRCDFSQSFQHCRGRNISRVEDNIDPCCLQRWKEGRVDCSCAVWNVCVRDNAGAKNGRNCLYNKSSFNSSRTCCELRKWIVCMPTARAPSIFSMKSSTKIQAAALTPNRSMILR